MLDVFVYLTSRKRAGRRARADITNGEGGGGRNIGTDTAGSGSRPDTLLDADAMKRRRLEPKEWPDLLDIGFGGPESVAS